MSERDAFDRTLASLHEAMLDDACGTKGNMLTLAEGQTQDDVEIFYVGFFFRGEHNRELEREYFTKHFPRDERIPRVRHLTDSQQVLVPDLFTDQERQISPAYDAVLPVSGRQNGLNMRPDRRIGSLNWVGSPHGARRRRRGHED